MSRNPRWERLSPNHFALLDDKYPRYSVNTNVQNFPRDCPHPDLLEMRGQLKNYSCSFEMALLALKIQRLSGISDKEISDAIKLTAEGSDPWNLYDGLQALGVTCGACEGMTTKALVHKLSRRDAIYIWNGQQPAYSTKQEVLDTVAGHFMAASCADEEYVYFADPGYPDGKTRILQKYLDLVWHDIELATGRLIHGFVIEVPFLL